MTVKATFIGYCDSVRQRELRRLGMALKRNLLDGFERNAIRYHVHACPDAVCDTTITAEVTVFDTL